MKPMMIGAGTLAGIVFLALAVTAGGWTLTHLAALKSIPALMDAGLGAEAAVGLQALLVCAALVFGALFFLMLYRRGGTSMAILILGAMLVFSHGMSPEASGCRRSFPSVSSHHTVRI